MKSFTSLEKLESSCDVCADLVFSDANKDQVIKMVELLAAYSSVGMLLIEFKKLISKHSFT